MPPPLLPKTQTAYIQTANGTLKLTPSAPLPHIPADRMLVRVIAVALNHCDWKMPSRFPCEGVVNGTDYAGIIVSIGSEVANLPTKPAWKVGDAIFGACHGANPVDPQSGAFAEYLRADPELVFRKPQGMSWETAAAIGCSGIATLGLALFWKGGMELSGSPENPVTAEDAEEVLVYAGSTSVGTMAIQLLRIYGHKPIVTCSPHNFALVKSYGADTVFDYHSPTCGEEIRQHTNNDLEYVLDPIVEAPTQRICYRAIGRAGGRYIALEAWQPMNHTRPSVEPAFIMGPAIIGSHSPLPNGYGFEADAEKRAFGIAFYAQIQKLLDERRLRAHPVRVIDGKWQGILEGLEMLKNKGVSGQRLVVLLSQP
ncbi:putative zinc-binding dehydrogenase family oxidoreductase [Aspergillus karnatakaensis]|uniref:zinc-binding alcohol dehydrogenase family protein n=1 Tax=Aspergillus karnatakaensis TaxID=1810916 RepID=UPI003CCD1469